MMLFVVSTLSLYLMHHNLDDSQHDRLHYDILENISKMTFSNKMQWNGSIEVVVNCLIMSQISSM